MAKNILLILIVLAFAACGTKPSYEVKIKLSGADGKVYLSQRQNGKWVKIDSTQLVNGEGTIKGTVAFPEIYYVEVSSAKSDFPLFVENAVISIEGKADSLQKVKITGSKVHDEYAAFVKKVEVVQKQAGEVYKKTREAKDAGNTAKADSLMAEAQKIFLEAEQMHKDYIVANPASFVAPYMLSQVSYEIEGDVLADYLSKLDRKLDSVQIVKSLKVRAEKLKHVSVGQITPDFTMNSVDGSPVKLSDFYSKNEYTLIDFWASWCGPCRGENPNVVAVYNDYNTKGFGVIGVSLDTKKEKWTKAIDDDKLTWTHVSDLKGWQNEAAALYAVNSIPMNLLVDKTGKIIARNLREEKLRETISGFLK
jgi:peroxiredoxin